MLACVLICCVLLLWGWRGNKRNPLSAEGDPLFDPLKHCRTRYGTILGYALSVPAFSNCHSSYSAERLVITRFGYPELVADHNDGSKGNYCSGSPWSSMEYTARILFHYKGIKYFEMPTPQEVWSTPYFFNPLEAAERDEERRYEPVRVANYEEATTAKERKRLAPRVFDIVVWPAQMEHELPVGHIAVVVQVEDDVEAAGGEDRLRELRKLRLPAPVVVHCGSRTLTTRTGEAKTTRACCGSSGEMARRRCCRTLGLKVLGLVRIGKRTAIFEDKDGGDL
ncbi:D-alanyl-glycyl endopeptidase-like protein [Trypanosoma cruzi]|nr:D-alanyl-glycyl endopeptidase-like protein [Trypanosoma cruzi]